VDRTCAADSVAEPKPRPAREEGEPDLPPLIAAAKAAQAWMECRITAHPAPQVALFAAVAVASRCGPARTLFLHVLAACRPWGSPTAVRCPPYTDAAAHLAGWGRPVT